VHCPKISDKLEFQGPSCSPFNPALLCSSTKLCRIGRMYGLLARDTSRCGWGRRMEASVWGRGRVSAIGMRQRWNRVVRVTGHRVPGQHFGSGRVRSRVSVQYTWLGLVTRIRRYKNVLSVYRCAVTVSVFGSSGTGRLSTVSIHVLRSCLMSYCKASAMMYTHAVNGRNIARWDFDNSLSYYTVSGKKRCHFIFACNFAKC